MSMNLYRLRKRCFAILNHITDTEEYLSRRAGNYGYSVPSNVCRQLKQGRLYAGEIFSKLDNRQQKILLQDVCRAANNRLNGVIAEPAHIENIKDCVSENLPYMTTEFLDRMEQVAMTSGLFMLSYIIREQNEKLVLQTPAPYNDDVRRATKLFWIFLTRGEYDAAAKLVNRPYTPLTVSQHLQALCSAFSLLPKEKKAYPDNPEHTAFAGCIENKSIAIIGPSSSGININDEIKHNFGTVIRFNYRGAGTLPEDQKSLAPHISYYRKFMNGVFSDPGEDISYLADLDYAVLKLPDEGALKNAEKHTKPRVKLEIPGFFFLGKHQMLQLTLQDLLFFNPKRIKIFNTNCNLTDTKHDRGYYTGKTSLGVLDQWRQHANHNILSQYDYLRELYKRGMFEADTRFAEVLELGREEYMRQIDAQEGKRDIMSAVE